MNLDDSDFDELGARMKPDASAAWPGRRVAAGGRLLQIKGAVGMAAASPAFSQHLATL